VTVAANEQLPSAVPPLLELPAQLLRDPEAVHRCADLQARQIDKRWNNPKRQVKATTTLIANRNSRARESADYLAIDTRRSVEQPLIARDEVLIASEDLTPQLARHLRSRGFIVTPVPELERRVFVIRLPKRRPTPRALRSAIAEHAASARSRRAPQRIDIRPHYLAPMGVVVKADVGPEPAPGLPPRERVEPGDFRVAVIDTGITDQVRTDGWLTAAPVGGNVDLLDDFPPAQLLDVGAGHGTFIAGVIERIEPTVGIDVHRALDSDGLGGEAAAATAIVRAAKAGARIINLSFGLETDEDEPPLALAAAVDIVRTNYPDVLLVAAAGNFGRARPCWPAAFKGVTAVAALTRTLDGAAWSSRGSWVDCSTIGEAVLSTFVKGREVDGDVYGADSWAVWSGTSFAAPQIVAAVAQVAQRSGIPVHDALARLLDGSRARPGWGRIVRILPPT
jgi:hypothetical protein